MAKFRRNFDGGFYRDILIAKNKAIIALKKAFDENDINIPFPIRTIDFTNRLSIDKQGDGE